MNEAQKIDMNNSACIDREAYVEGFLDATYGRLSFFHIYDSEHKKARKEVASFYKSRDNR